MRSFTIMLCCMMLFNLNNLAGAPYFEGRIRVTVRDTARNKDIPITIIYPADSASGDNRPIVGTGSGTIPKFGIVVMGHGYQMPVTAYKSFATNICKSVGSYVVVLPETGTGLFPNHNDFALDMVAACTYMQREGKRQGSVWNGHIANDNVFAGHSMGGGAAFLAAKQALQTNGLNITAVIGMAPAETNPSSSAAAAFVTCPTLVLAGSIDCVTPLAGTVRPIYNNVASTCKTLAVIPGASHCQFADANSTCNLGELNCQATIARDVQLNRCWQYIKFLLGRSDSVASVIADTQIESSLIAIRNADVSISKPQACDGDTIRCTYGGKAASILWLPDSVRGNTYSFVARGGTPRIRVVNTSCFGSTAIDTSIVVYDRPTVRIEGPTMLCPTDSIVLKATTNASSEHPMAVLWSTGSTTESIVVRQAGVYTVTLVSARGCGQSVASHSIDVAVLPSISLRLLGDTISCSKINPLEVQLIGDLDLAKDIRWNTGDTTRRVAISTPGTYTLSATMRTRDEMACMISTDTVTFTFRGIQPTVPEITFRNDTLWSSLADTYIWMLDDQVITGATSSFHVPIRSGLYTVKTILANEWGCAATSKPMRVTTSSVDENPNSRVELSIVDNILHLTSGHPKHALLVYSTTGAVVQSVTLDGLTTTSTLDITALSTGVYAVVVDGVWLGNFIVMR